jgi:hypothetical protein
LKSQLCYKLPLAIRLRGDLSNAAAEDLRVIEGSDELENKIALREIDNEAIAGLRMFGPIAQRAIRLVSIHWPFFSIL